MKVSLPSLKHAAFAAALASSLSFASAKNGADDGAQGGDISGSESTQQKTALIATADAPAGAGGKLELEAENEHGTATTTLHFELFGLPAGTYAVAATKRSDGSVVDLGTFDYQVVTPPPGDGDSSNDSAHRAPVTRSKGSDDGGGSVEQEVTFGENGLTLPPGFNPLDLASITISNSDSVAILTADLGANTGLFKARVDVVPGDFGPDATGYATLKVQSKKGKLLVKQLHLVVNKLQGRTTYTVAVNGEPVGTVKTNPRGKISYNRLKSVNPSTLHSVQLLTTGGVAAEVNF